MSAVRECGGCLPVHIDEGGYIYALDRDGMRDFMVHRETRNMHNQPNAMTHVECRMFILDRMLDDGRDSYGGAVGVLETSPDGHGQALYVPEITTELWDSRLKFWKGCYGAWPISAIRA